MENQISNIRTIRAAITKIEQVINLNVDNICSGKASYEAYVSLGSSLETISEIVEGETSSASWKQLYEILKNGQYTADIASLLSAWLILTEHDLIDIEKRIGHCHMCENDVVYLKNDGYFRNMQKIHNFKYWYGSFETISTEKRTCPVCGSMDRERLISMFIKRLSASNEEKVKVLQIAPSRAMETWLENRKDFIYESTDLFMSGVTFNADIQDLNMVENDTYDIVLCSHILEHVENDRKAMQELLRVIKPDGLCIFLVPIISGITDTDEEFGCNEAENWYRFGQDDHARLYGKEDLLDRLSETGFSVYTVGQEFFSEEEWNSAGLASNSCLYVASKNPLDMGIEPYKIVPFEEELVSVVIPTHNRDHCIKESIESVLNQSYKNLELFVVDDCSTDDTDAVIADIKDDRLKYIKLDKNMGANAARNIGIERAKGKYIAFNDSDDCWHSDKLYKQMKYMKLLERTEHAPIGAVYCGFERIKDGESLGMIPDFSSQGEHIIGYIYEYMQSHMFISTQTLLFNREILKEVGQFNESLKRLQDWELMLRVAAKYKIMPIQESLVDVKVSGDALSNNDSAWWDTLKYVFELHNMRDNNINAYLSLVFNTAYMLGEKNVPIELKEDFYDYIAADNAISQIHLKSFKRILFEI